MKGDSLGDETPFKGDSLGDENSLKVTV